MWKLLQDWWRAEGDLARLKGLDDRILADMGLDRPGLRARVMGQQETHAAPAADCRPQGLACSCGAG